MFNHRAFVALDGKQLSRAVLCHVEPFAYRSLLRHLVTLPWSGSESSREAWCSLVRRRRKLVTALARMQSESAEEIDGSWSEKWKVTFSLRQALRQQDHKEELV